MTKTITHIEIAEVEAQARRMRAETMRAMWVGVANWFKGIFGGQSAHGAHRA